MGAKSLSLEQMYRVLRGLPGEMTLVAPDGNTYTLTVENPNAPKNRCQETLGLSVSLSGPQGSEQRELSEDDLFTLRSGEALTINLLNVEVVLRSNPGGHLIDLEH